MVLHLPGAVKKPRKQAVGYEIYPGPRDMHIAIKDGTKKYSFGNVTNITDVAPTGPSYREGHPVKVVAVAHVPVLDNGEQKVLGFYLDEIALGSYKETGRVAQTIGYNWTHLEDGDFVPKSEAVIEPEVEVAAPEPPKPKPTPAPAPEPAPVKLSWKEQIAQTYQPFDDGPVWFIAKEDMLVRDFATVRAPKRVSRYAEILIAGTFKVDGRVYGRPQQAVEAGLTWGIPINKLVEKITETAEDHALYTVPQKPYKLNLKFYSVNTDGRLTKEEALVTAPLAKASGKYLDAVNLVREKIKTIRR
jgi:hypothetical protein